MKNLQISLLLFCTTISTTIMGSEQKFRIEYIGSRFCEETDTRIWEARINVRKKSYKYTGSTEHKAIKAIIEEDLAQEDRGCAMHRLAKEQARLKEQLQAELAQIAYEQKKRTRHEQLLAHCAKTVAEEGKKEGLSIIVPVTATCASSMKSSSGMRRSTKSFADMDQLGNEDQSEALGFRK
jgi:hypothetical protein